LDCWRVFEFTAIRRESLAQYFKSFRMLLHVRYVFINYLGGNIAPVSYRCLSRLIISFVHDLIGRAAADRWIQRPDCSRQR